MIRTACRSNRGEIDLGEKPAARKDANLLRGLLVANEALAR